MQEAEDVDDTVVGDPKDDGVPRFLDPIGGISHMISAVPSVVQRDAPAKRANPFHTRSPGVVGDIPHGLDQ